jgi:hypothetical protein
MNDRGSECSRLLKLKRGTIRMTRPEILTAGGDVWTL